MGLFGKHFGGNFDTGREKQRFLIDENVLGIDRYLASLKVDLVRVGDPDAPPLGSDDGTVANYAKEHKLTVITNDEKLAKQCKFQEVPFIITGMEDLAKKVKEYVEKSQK